MLIWLILFTPTVMRPHVYIGKDNVTFFVDDRVSLECNIEDTGVFIAAKWIREETKEILETTNFSKSSSANSKPLYHRFLYVIKKVSTKDKGIYKCVANFSGYGPVDAWYKLLVRGKCCNDIRITRLGHPKLSLLRSSRSPSFCQMLNLCSCCWRR